MRGAALLVAVWVVLVVVGVSGGVPPRHYELTGYTFGRYVDDFAKEYVLGTAEYDHRKRLFERELEGVRRHNADGRATYKKGVNRYSDWTVEEKRHLRGVLGGGAARDAVGAEPVHGAGDDPLPVAVDYRTAVPAVLTSVKDQGKCGSCWAHSVTQAVETYVAMATGKLFVLSQQQVTACTPPPARGAGGCDGSMPEFGFNYLVKEGKMLEEWQYPYESYWTDLDGTGMTPKCRMDKFGPLRSVVAVTLEGYHQVARNSAAAMQKALAHIGPLAVVVAAGDWFNYETGVFSGCSGSSEQMMDHAVQAVGYGVDSDTGQAYWLIRNSWSASWGEAGYIRLARYPGNEPCGKSNEGHKVCGECGVASDALYPKLVPRQ